jgi:hypothetical protein
MCVDHGSLDALMAEKGLDLPDVDALHQKVGGEAVAEGMDGSVFHNASLFCDMRFCRYFRPKAKSSQVIFLLFFDFKDFLVDSLQSGVIDFAVKRKFL